MATKEEQQLKIAQPLTLKCGLTLPNRLMKAALAESWADRNALPTQKLVETYGAWADGGWGMVLTGNVQVDVNHLGTPWDISVDHKLPREKIIESWKRWAKVSSGNGETPIVMQLNHPGRQSLTGAGKRGLFAKSIAPSAIPLNLGGGLIPRTLSALMFGTPKAMTKEDISSVVSQFADAALLAAESGFAGVEIHAAHGYLLSQFLNPTSNQRTDEYGQGSRGRAKIVVETINAIKKAVAAYPKFCVGIKLNSADHQNSTALKECIEQIQDVVAAGVDFLEISGGNYENPTMMSKSADEQPASSTVKREAFYLEFTRLIRSQFPGTTLVLTGGFRTRQGMEDALAEDACDFIGLGRPSVLDPLLPRTILLNESVVDEKAVLYARKVPSQTLIKKLGVHQLVGGAETLWYQKQMYRMLELVAGYQ